MKVSDYIVDFFARHGVRYIYGYIGGMITHLVDSIDKSELVDYVQTYHEQTAGFAAEGYAIGSGNVGVAICTSGPGVTNMITAIADAYFDSVPVIFISGQVNTTDYKYSKRMRQQGFQEMNVVDLVSSISKYAVLLDNPRNIRYELEKAVYIATNGRKGPVVIDLPMDISRADVNVNELHPYIPHAINKKSANLSIIHEKLLSSHRPLLLLGGGTKNAREGLEELLNRLPIPVVNSLKGKGALDESYEYYVGMIGSYGNRCANMAVDKCDLLIALGTRLDTRQTGARYKDFIQNTEIIHIDIDEIELEECRIKNRIPVQASVEEVVSYMSELQIPTQKWENWLKWVMNTKRNYNQQVEIERFVDNKMPYKMMQFLNTNTGIDDIFVVDVGQNEIWAAQTIILNNERNFVCSGGLAPMGFALPVSIGIAMSQPNRKIFAIVGDGGLQMSMQALLTIQQYQLNISIIVLNNKSLGMITQFQHLYFNDNMVGTTMEGGYQTMNFESLAASCGIKYVALHEIGLEEDKWLNINEPVMIDYLIDGLTSVSPKLEYNGLYSMPTPQLDHDEYERAMN